MLDLHSFLDDVLSINAVAEEYFFQLEMSKT